MHSQFSNVLKPSFLLQFRDVGSGVVNITEMGGVTATFTRATTATTIGSTGLVIASGSGSPRSYYDPTSLAYLGYLAEGARTNLNIRSQEIDDAAYAKTDTSVTANNTTSPDGTANADLLTEGSAGTAATVGTAQAITAGAAVSASVWFKRSAVVQWVFVRAGNAAGTNVARGWFDIQNGVKGSTALVGTATVASSTMKAYPNGWFLCTLSVTPDAADNSSNVAWASASADTSTTRVNNSAYFVWGVQNEQAAFASSYIPTTTVTVTRNADVLTYPSTGWLASGVGTLLTQAQFMAIDASNYTIAAINDTTGNSHVWEFQTGGTQAHQVRDATVNQCNLTGAGVTAGTTTKGVGAYAVNDFAFSRSGAAVTTDASGTVPAFTRMDVGTYAGASTFGAIRQIAYYNSRLPNATLISLSS